MTEEIPVENDVVPIELTPIAFPIAGLKAIWVSSVPQHIYYEQVGMIVVAKLGATTVFRSTTGDSPHLIVQSYLHTFRIELDYEGMVTGIVRAVEWTSQSETPAKE